MLQLKLSQENAKPTSPSPEKQLVGGVGDHVDAQLGDVPPKEGDLLAEVNLLLDLVLVLPDLFEDILVAGLEHVEELLPPGGDLVQEGDAPDLRPLLGPFLLRQFGQTILKRDDESLPIYFTKKKKPALLN